MTGESLWFWRSVLGVSQCVLTQRPSRLDVDFRAADAGGLRLYDCGCFQLIVVVSR